MDRRIGHIMTHCVLFRTIDRSLLPEWFEEGVCEFIPGGDEKLASALASLGGPAGVVNQLSLPWVNSADQWAAGYAAVKYLHQISLSEGHDGIREVLHVLAGGGNLDMAIKAATNGRFNSEAEFLADYQGANGQAFIASLNVTDSDVGGIGGGDSHSVILNSNTDDWDPLEGFEVDWEGKTWRPKPGLNLQVGEEAGDTLVLPTVAVTGSTLGIRRVNLVLDPAKAINRIDGAIEKVSQYRAQLGAVQNRLEAALRATEVAAENETAGESRIRDADMARESTELVKAQVLQQAALAMEAQAELVRRGALQELLRFGR
jgi:flagellin